MMNLHTPPPADIFHLLDPAGDKGSHVTTPRASCLERHGNRMRLSRLLIGDVALFGVLMVARVATDTYQIYKRGYTFEVALGIIENRLDPTKPKPRGKKPKTPKAKQVVELPLTDLPMFAMKGSTAA